MKILSNKDFETLNEISDLYSYALNSSYWFHEYEFMQSAMIRILDGQDPGEIREQFKLGLDAYVERKILERRGASQ